MGPTIKEKKFAIIVTNQCLLMYISGQNARHLYNLKINKINNKLTLWLNNNITFKGEKGIFCAGRGGTCPQPFFMPLA